MERACPLRRASVPGGCFAAGCVKCLAALRAQTYPLGPTCVNGDPGEMRLQKQAPAVLPQSAAAFMALCASPRVSLPGLGAGPPLAVVVKRSKPGRRQHPTLTIAMRKSGRKARPSGLQRCPSCGCRRAYQADSRRLSEHGQHPRPGPDTAYGRDCPVGSDGLIRTEPQRRQCRTRAEPKPYAGGRVFHVYPPGYQGTKIEPAFDGLMCAYNYYCGGGDTVTAGPPRPAPDTP